MVLRVARSELSRRLERAGPRRGAPGASAHSPCQSITQRERGQRGMRMAWQGAQGAAGVSTVVCGLCGLWSVG